MFEQRKAEYEQIGWVRNKYHHKKWGRGGGGVTTTVAEWRRIWISHRNIHHRVAMKSTRNRPQQS